MGMSRRLGLTAALLLAFVVLAPGAANANHDGEWRYCWETAPADVDEGGGSSGGSEGGGVVGSDGSTDPDGTVTDGETAGGGTDGGTGEGTDEGVTWPDDPCIAEGGGAGSGGGTGGVPTSGEEDGGTDPRAAEGGTGAEESDGDGDTAAYDDGVPVEDDGPISVPTVVTPPPGHAFGGVADTGAAAGPVAAVDAVTLAATGTDLIPVAAGAGALVAGGGALLVGAGAGLRRRRRR